ncbi:MAG: 16S rRNA (guanine(527)-N(7))-methyltransferase RsmG [Caldilineaceae bacterium]|nr:16S rRNA (guanine(527)-N(7))-methyltransferase RsmG [Caldilineaceae bacterium]
MNEPLLSVDQINFDPAQHQQILQTGCAALGLQLSQYQLTQFELYSRCLVAWNAKFNLTAITDYDEIQIKHFLDCLAGLPVMMEELGADLPLDRPLHLADVGAGAGFPGLPLKLAAPSLTVTLIDGTGKKITFLKAMVDALKLVDINIVQGRAEELGRQASHRDQYDLVTARAVAPLNTLAEYLLPLVSKGGYAVVYKGSSAPQEFIDARKAIDLLGGEVVRFAPVDVPYLEGKRYIVLIRKNRETPRQYPRGQGLARKQPLG